MKGGVGFYWKKCGIPPCDRFFLGKKFFFGFSENFSKFFFNEIDCKKIFEIFFNEFSSETFSKFFCMLNDYTDNSRHNMTKNLQNSKFYFFESDFKTDKKHL